VKAQGVEEIDMRQELVGAMFAAVLALALGTQASVASSACAQPPAMNGNYVKPSSLAPGERAYNNAYGAPVSKPIVSKHVRHKAKTQPQLHTSPLP
jgi:hypothetical protein